MESKNKNIKGILLSGGHGSRLNSFTKTVTNKHLAPVYSKDGATPMIDYPIDTLKKVGITDILVITSKEHCGDIVEHLGDGYDRGLNFTYKIQEMNDPERPIGIASALKLARDFTGDDNFVVILGDNYFEYSDHFKECVDTMNDQSKLKCGIFLKQVDNWQDYGVAKFGEKYENGYTPIIDIVEKPKEYISDWAVTGMYVYTSDVYQYLDKLEPSKRGELEISDINRNYAQKDLTWSANIDTFWGDMGTIPTMLKVQEYLNNEK